MAMTDLTNELQMKFSSLNRAPCPKPPVGGRPTYSEKPNFLKEVKLKPTQTSVTNDSGKNGKSSDINNKTSDRQTVGRVSSVKDRAKMLENGSLPKKPSPPTNKPLITPKPPIGVKPSPGKPAIHNSAKNQDYPAKRPPSVIDKPKAEIPEGFEDNRVPELCPLPLLSQIGDPPKKPPKLWPFKQTLAKYIGTCHPTRPTSAKKTPPSVEEDKHKPALPLSTDVSIENQNEEKREDSAADVTEEPTGEESTSEDFYDDTLAPVENVDVTEGTQGETFGEDIYEPIKALEDENYELLPAENESPPPTLPPHTEKKMKEQTKEDKKKKEKEEKEKRKKEKEEKEKEEKERKKREKEKERKLTDMKKRFSVRGNERSLGTCCAAVDIQGNKMDISATIGEVVDIIRKDKNPNNKWLVRNSHGQYGFIDIDKIQTEGKNNSEDLYEEVSAVKASIQSFEGDDLPTPPATSPPPPPKSAPTSSPGNQDIYDDVLAEEEGEELYEPLDN